MRNITIITAMDFNNAIGKDNKLLCKLTDDLRMFQRMTTGHVVVMGRKTFESIGKPLPNRVNVVLTRDTDYKIDGIDVFNSIEEILHMQEHMSVESLFIIGGGEIYNQFLPHADTLIVTRIENFFDDADAFFPKVNWDEWIESIAMPKHFEADDQNEFAFTTYLYFRK